MNKCNTNKCLIFISDTEWKAFFLFINCMRAYSLDVHIYEQSKEISLTFTRESNLATCKYILLSEN